MGTVWRNEKDAIKITGDFSQTEAFRIYFDVAADCGFSGANVLCYDDKLVLCGTDSHGDGFEVPFYKQSNGNSGTPKELSDLLAGEGTVSHVKCNIHTKCETPDKKYSVKVVGNGGDPVYSIILDAEKTANGWGFGIRTTTLRPNYHRKATAELEDKLKEKLKPYGASVEMV